MDAPRTVVVTIAPEFTEAIERLTAEVVNLRKMLDRREGITLSSRTIEEAVARGVQHTARKNGGRA